MKEFNVQIRARIPREADGGVAEQFRFRESALLVWVSSLPVREQVIGLLHGFQGETVRVPLPNKGGYPYSKAGFP
jgi:hypothetical protein